MKERKITNLTDKQKDIIVIVTREEIYNLCTRLWKEKKGDKIIKDPAARSALLRSSQKFAENLLEKIEERMKLNISIAHLRQNLK